MDRRRITGRELAAGAGTTEATVSRYLSGARSPENFEILARTAEFLDVSADYLLGLTNNPFQKRLSARGSKRIARPISSGERRRQKSTLGDPR